MNSITRLKPQRILVCQQRQLGDVVISTICVDLLKKRFPNAEIHMLTEKKCTPILEHNPNVDKIWPIDRSLGVMRSLAFYWKVARYGYDLMVDFQQLPRIRWIFLLSNAPCRLTFKPAWYTRFLYTHWSNLKKGGYAGNVKSAVLHPLGIEYNNEPPRIYLTDDEKAYAETLFANWGLQNDDIIVTVDATHRSPTRKWPAEHYAKLIRLAVERRSNLKFILLWGPGETKDVSAVRSLSKVPDNCLLPDKMLSLREMAAVIERADLHVGNCSAPRHFAVALDTPSLTIIGSTGNTAWSYPSPHHQWVDGGLEQGLTCRQCNKDVCPEHGLQCLRGLQPETVLSRMESLIEDVLG